MRWKMQEWRYPQKARGAKLKTSFQERSAYVWWEAEETKSPRMA